MMDTVAGNMKEKSKQLKVVRWLLWTNLLLFSFLFLFRSNVFFSEEKSNAFLFPTSEMNTFTENENWMNIYLHQEKIGIYHSTIRRNKDNYEIEETFRMRVDLLGMISDVNVETKGILKSDFSLLSFDMRLSSERFSYSARGEQTGSELTVSSGSDGNIETHTLRVNDKLYLSAGLSTALAHSKFSEEDELTGYLFDVSTLGKVPFRVTLEKGNQQISATESTHIGRANDIKKYRIEANGLSQYAWISDSGKTVREEGIMGLSMEATTKENALSEKIAQNGGSLALNASIKSPKVINHPEKLSRLSVMIKGIDFSIYPLDGGRQRLHGEWIIIEKEKIQDIPDTEKYNHTEKGEILRRYLSPSPLIQSNHPKMKSTVENIVSPHSSDREKVMALLTWIHRNIEKRPVISLPDALSTLTLRMGDCNEHAVLFAAMGRAAGIPSQVETGLVYLNGRFFYHAWNLVYIGKWVTIDSVFNQFPADITHIRFSAGHEGIPLDILGIIGKVEITDIRYD